MAENEEKEMTMEEREQWLRDRGVQIENPSYRKKADNSASNVLSVTEQLTNLDVSSFAQQQQPQDGSVQFVWIPCDDTKPLQTLRLPANSQGGGDLIPDYVKSHFADSKSIDATLLQQQATKHFAGGSLGKDLDTSKISTAAMNAVAAQGSVETFPLVHPAASNGAQGVYIYLDEVGLLKKLPPNQRASQLATGCGYHPPPQFYGDVFVGRVCTQNPGRMRNLDFVAGIDTDPAAPWLLQAPQENVAWQQEMNRVTNKQGATQPAHAGTEGTEVQEDNYTWTQEEDDLELVVDFGNQDAAIDKKQLKVKFMTKSITVVYKGNNKLSLKLYASIDVDACTWTIDGGKKLVITCEKANPGELWPRVKG